jgi:hypothetical protein
MLLFVSIIVSRFVVLSRKRDMTTVVILLHYDELCQCDDHNTASWRIAIRALRITFGAQKRGRGGG